MRRKTETVKYRVEGCGPFPLDMLRYDGAYPADEQASRRIENTFWAARPNPEEPREPGKPIELVATHNGCPNHRRWESFMWKVTAVWTGYDWQPYCGETVRK